MQHALPWDDSALGPVPPALAALRGAGRARFGAVGFPTTRDEAWHYTSVRRMLDTPRVLASDAAVSEADVAALRVAGAEIELVFVNGRLHHGLSRTDTSAIRVSPLSLASSLGQAGTLGALASLDDGFTALTAACARDGVVIRAPRGATSTGPVHVLHLVRGDSSAIPSVRHVIDLEPNADLALVTTTVIDGVDALVNETWEIQVGAGARLRWQNADQAGRGAVLRSTAAVVGHDATFQRHTTTLSGALVRDALDLRLTGSGVTCALDGLYLPAAGEHADHRTVVRHEAAHGTTRESYKGVIGGGGRGVFDGTVIVGVAGTGTDARQSSRNLLLAVDAEADAKPRLEIYTDDVKCSHGTTVGQLDANQLAYLRSRGIPNAVARGMLTEAFVAEEVDAVWDTALRARLDALVRARLDALLGRSE
jgi:Fe-S cluster assembly protein SufD